MAHYIRILYINIWKRPEKIGKIVIEIQPVFFSCFHNTVDYRTGTGATWSVGKKPGFPSHDKRFYGALCPVVVELQPAIFQKTKKLGPLIPTIIDGCPQGALGHYRIGERIRPCFE